ncbi:hypothetical protein [Micromonospora eburnea]|uniref:HicB family protein n=1 Tax=Micromonospora eburnea TaxID=227316 RepID=A0A1C6V741_9ACTN|nr:hypothetical protein [Micromonospora eburnea]SCL62128.1 hypothetical protein GA0070604_4668 [Micromonospora eburnea]
MDLTSYVDSLRRELAGVAELGGDEVRALAERLSGSMESAFRLALLEALSAAAGEITRDLAPGSVELRLRGREASFVVTPPPVEPQFQAGPVSSGAEAPTVPDAEDGPVSRISFRLPDQLKSRIEEAASREGLSVNAWLVRAATAAVHSVPPGHPAARAPRGGQRYTGWVR